jgi:hypothetical protein
MAKFSDKLHNLRTQLYYPDLKIFFIGFNRCGTTSIHRLLQRAGIWSAHLHVPMMAINPFNLRKPISRFHVNLATAIEGRTTHTSVRKVFRPYTAVSDLFFFSNTAEIEGICRFREFHEIYKDAYFVLNDRNPDNWIRSRRRYDGGSLLRRAEQFHSTNAANIEEMWRAARARHVADVLSYFSGYRRFLHFRIDTDEISLLSDFLSPNYRVDPYDWAVENASEADSLLVDGYPVSPDSRKTSS